MLRPNIPSFVGLEGLDYLRTDFLSLSPSAPDTRLSFIFYSSPYLHTLL